ncbi:hypothetical protein D9757_009322 [Collybiopsis confluens]|uniref:Uncharacterized protein n=1 Tax=Collybiopsis confluens TaxID=2823264 RepID=A0A8H5H3Q6_9AGAR|nr:hypothetical protein D9757_009322 [Collybiopsis confluens]
MRRILSKVFEENRVAAWNRTGHELALLRSPLLSRRSGEGSLKTLFSPPLYHVFFIAAVTLTNLIFVQARNVNMQGSRSTFVAYKTRCSGTSRRLGTDDFDILLNPPLPRLGPSTFELPREERIGRAHALATPHRDTRIARALFYPSPDFLQANHPHQCKQYSKRSIPSFNSTKLSAGLGWEPFDLAPYPTREFLEAPSLNPSRCTDILRQTAIQKKTL